MKRRSLPLGVDLGTTAIRIAELSDQPPALLNVASVRVPSGASDAERVTLLRDLTDRSGWRGRQCIMTLDEPHAIVREAVFPPMHRRDLQRAAALEASRWTRDVQTSEIRVADLGDNRFALGVAARADLRRMRDLSKRAGLRLVAVDHASYALTRAFPHADAVVDIGRLRTRFVATKGLVPFTSTLELGGDAFTLALATAYRIDWETAEQRKRSSGIGNNADNELATLTAFVGRAIRAARSNGIAEIERIILTGNGSRPAALAPRLERDTGCIVEIAARFDFDGGAFPADVLRAAAPEWGLCIGTALWMRAEAGVA